MQPSPLVLLISSGSRFNESVSLAACLPALPLLMGPIQVLVLTCFLVSNPLPRSNSFPYKADRV